MYIIILIFTISHLISHPSVFNMYCLVVTFGHRSVFPVMFDADSLEKWWKSALVFKIYCKSPLQKLVCFPLHVFDNNLCFYSFKQRFFSP